MEWKEKALEYRAEHLEHGETIICGSELLDKTGSYEQWLSAVTENADPLTVNPNLVVTDTFLPSGKATPKESVLLIHGIY